MNHYEWCEINFRGFLNSMGSDIEFVPGLIAAHGDKAWSYKQKWESNCVPFNHGVAIYLLSYLSPWTEEVRQVENGLWVDPSDWVISNYNRFKPYLIG